MPIKLVYVNESSTSIDVIQEAKQYPIAGKLIVLEKAPSLRKVAQSLTKIDGVIPVSRAVYTLTKKPTALIPNLEEFERIVFVRTREIPRVRKDQSSIIYILLHYRVRNPTTQQKKRIERLIKHSMCIKLRSGVLLFPHLRAKHHRKIYDSDRASDIMDSKQLGTELESQGAEVFRWAFLKPFTELDENRINTLIESSFLNATQQLESQSRNLRDNISKLEFSEKRLKKRFTSISARYKLYKNKWMLISEIWNVNVDKSIKRIYNILLNNRRMIKSRF